MKNEGCRCGTGLGGVLLAFLGGATIGAAAAYLSAPRPGTESRARLRALANGAQDGATRLPEALRRAAIAAGEAFERELERNG